MYLISSFDNQKLLILFHSSIFSIVINGFVSVCVCVRHLSLPQYYKEISIHIFLLFQNQVYKSPAVDFCISFPRWISKGSETCDERLRLSRCPSMCQHMCNPACEPFFVCITLFSYTSIFIDCLNYCSFTKSLMSVNTILITIDSQKS